MRMGFGQEEKKSYYQHENISMENETLPINIRLRTSDHSSFGCEFHWHEELEFYYVERGGVLLLCNGKQQWIYEGQVGFVNWCQLHRGIKFLDNTRHYIIQIGTKFFSEETVSFHQEQAQCNYLSILIACSQQIPLVFSEDKNIAGWLKQIISLYRDKNAMYELRLKSAVYGLLACLAEYAHYDPLLKADSGSGTDLTSLAHMKKILFFLSGNYMYPDRVTLPRLSRQFGLSVPYICRIFKKYTSMTVIAYLQQLRCTRAAAFIREGVSLEEASLLTGFQDYNYFSRIFKKVIGMSPSGYKVGMIEK